MFTQYPLEARKDVWALLCHESCEFSQAARAERTDAAFAHPNRRSNFGVRSRSIVVKQHRYDPAATFIQLSNSSSQQVLFLQFDNNLVRQRRGIRYIISTALLVIVCARL